MKGVPGSFRISWLVLTTLTLIGSLSLTVHQSVNPDVAGRYSYHYCVVLVVALLLSVAISIGNNRKVLEQIYLRRHEGLLLGVSLLLALSAVEVAIRLLDPLGISYYEEESRYAHDKVADQDLGFRHRSSWKAHYQGVDVSFNESGLRDEHIGGKEDNECRILVLGDSVTFGWGVDQHATFSAQLQRLLNSQLGRPVRVINSGVGGYNTVQELIFFKTKGMTFHPDMVVLVYTAENDTEPSGVKSLDPLRTVEGAVLWKSWLYRLASHAYYYGWLGSVGHNEATVSQTPGWQASIEAVKNLVAMSQGMNVPVIIFYFRWQTTALNGALLQDIQRAALPMPVVDMGEWFDGPSYSEYLNSKVDSHPNVIAHTLIAQKMATYLLQYSPHPAGVL